MWKTLACMLISMGSTVAYADSLQRDVWHKANVGNTEIAFQFFSGGRFIERVKPPAAPHGITYYGRYSVDGEAVRLVVDAFNAFNFGDTALPASNYVGYDFTIRLQGGEMLLPYALGIPDADRSETTRLPVSLVHPRVVKPKPKAPPVHDAYQPPPITYQPVQFLDAQLPCGAPCK